jgi:cytochrome c biogenesis protein
MKKNFKFLIDLRFAISILMLICFIIFLGSIIEQDQSIEFYKKHYLVEKPVFGFITWKLITFLQLDHIYKTIWFIVILFILALSLFLCSFIQQFPNLKFSRQCNFHKEKKLDLHVKINRKNIGKFFYEMKFSGYFIFQNKSNFYATKGIIGKIAPLFVHLSLILILFGSILDSTSSFISQELVPKAEIFHAQNIVNSGFFTFLYKSPLRVNDFWINYYPDNKIKQFYSNISILTEKGEEDKTKTISVNNPLIYENITFYQNDWTLVALRINEKEKYFQLPLLSVVKQEKKIWLTWFPNINYKKENIFGKTFLLNDCKESFLIYNLNGTLLKNIDLNEFILNTNYKIVDVIASTGLQIKSNQGILYVYGGFGLLMISTFLSYISFSQILGIYNYQKQFDIYAKTNRSKSSFHIEIFKLTKNI